MLFERMRVMRYKLPIDTLHHPATMAI
jgi:hypothetical protein